MNATPSCPSCGQALPPGAPKGLCPECLLKAGLGTGVDLGSESGPGGPAPGFVPPSSAELGRFFPQLEILEFIGKGGMGAVYMARQKELDRIVALKILPPGVGQDAAFAERFTREAKALARLNHPGIVTIHDFGRTDGLYFFLMEYVDGVSLRQLLANGRVSPREALAIVPQICDALQFAHDRGIVHRDIKPENLLIDKTGRVKIADFGLAKLMGQGIEPAAAGGPAGSSLLTDAGKVMGTPLYMAPEQAEHPGDVDHRADIYALGVVFYQMLTGELPDKRLEPPSRKVAIDVRLDEVVLRALERNPERRYQQASVFKTQVETFSANVPDLEVRPKEANLRPRLSRLAVLSAVCPVLFMVGPLVKVLPLSYVPEPLRSLLRFSDSIAQSAIAGTTILGWIAMTQLRRSAGRLYGMGLAVFGGLFGPLLILDVILWQVASFVLRGSAFRTSIEFLLLVLPALATLDALLARWVWREMGKSLDNPSQTGSAPRLANVIALGCAFAGVILSFTGADVLTPPESAKGGPGDWANWPRELALRPTAQVIQAALANPESAWPWQELENRARAGKFSPSEAQTLLMSLTDWLKREHPHGYDQPLNWMRGIMGELAKPGMVRDEQILGFLIAFHGDPYLDELPRLRHGNNNLQLTCHWISPWHEKPFGCALLNDMLSVSIDGEAIEGFRAYPKSRDFPFVNVDLRLPALSPGKHVVKCEIDRALIPESDLTGVSSDAPSADWPAAKRRWTHTSQAELLVYSEDAQIVGLTNDPALYPLAPDAASSTHIVLQRKGQGANASVLLKLSDKVPLSFDIGLRIDGQTYGCGTIMRAPHVGGGNSGSADIDPVDAKIKTADVVLTPNARAVELYRGVDWIWGHEIVLSNIPLTRHDLPPANSASAR
jgi:serine/threonine protein kinase